MKFQDLSIEQARTIRSWCLDLSDELAPVGKEDSNVAIFLENLEFVIDGCDRLIDEKTRKQPQPMRLSFDADSFTGEEVEF